MPADESISISLSDHHPRRTARGKPANGLGVAGLVIACVCLTGCWVPAFNIFLMPSVLFGGILSLVGLLVAMSNGRTGTGWPVAGIAFNLLSFAAILAVNALAFGWIASTVAELDREADREQSRQVRAMIVTRPHPPARPAPTSPVVPPAIPSPIVEAPAPTAVESRIVEAPEPTPPAPEGPPAGYEATLFRMGGNLEKAGKAKAALENYRRVVAEYPGTPTAGLASTRIGTLGGK